MPSGSEVRPGRWSHVIDLFDDGVYSAIWGFYENDEKALNPRCLGVRWNGDPNTLGYPNARGYPQWHVEPDNLQGAILEELQRQVLGSEYPGDSESHLANIRSALNELKQRAKSN